MLLAREANLRVDIVSSRLEEWREQVTNSEVLKLPPNDS